MVASLWRSALFFLCHAWEYCRVQIKSVLLKLREKVVYRWWPVFLKNENFMFEFISYISLLLQSGRKLICSLDKKSHLMPFR